MGTYLGVIATIKEVAAEIVVNGHKVPWKEQTYFEQQEYMNVK